MSLLLRKRSRYRMIRSIYARGVTGNLSEPWNQGTLFQDSVGTTPVTAVEQGIGRISDTSGSGNHLIQATGAAEPVWSKKHNLIGTYSEELNTGNWLALGAVPPTVLANQATIPGRSTATADKIVEGIGTGYGYLANYGALYSGGYVVNDITFKFKAKIKAAGRNYAFLRLHNNNNNLGASGCIVNLVTGVVTNPPAPLAPATTAVTESLGDGWWLVTAQSTCIGTVASTGGPMYAACLDNTFASSGGAVPAAYANDGSSGILVGEVELFINDMPYQRIAATNDYDTAGFLPYEKFDGLDDSFTCATGGGSTTAFSLQMAVMLEGAAAAQTLFSDAGTNIGLKIERDASNQIVLSGGNGGTFVPATSAAQTVGAAAVLTCKYNGTLLYIRINKGTPVTAAVTLSAGTAGFTVGKANGAASSYFNGRMYGRAYFKNYLLTDAEENAGIEFLAAKAGISL